MTKIFFILACSLPIIASAKANSDFERGYREGLKGTSGRLIITEGYPDIQGNDTRTKLGLLCEGGQLKQVACITNSDAPTYGKNQTCAGICVTNPSED